MSKPLLSRGALALVLRSLIEAELRNVRGRRNQPQPALSGPLLHHWSDNLQLGVGGLDCDSLELLSLAAATNEMFHLHEAGDEASLMSAHRFGDWLDSIEFAWRSGVKHVTFMTSGSTGRPKRCTHVAAHLHVEIEALAAHWSDRRRVVGLVPAHHIYGFLFTAMLPDRLGVPCLAAQDLGPSYFAGEIQAGDLVVSFPEHWAYLQRSLPRWPSGVDGVVSTAPCPPSLIIELQAQGLARMTEVYGSSETAGVAWRDAPDAPYRLMPQWRFVDPLDEAAPVLVHVSGLHAPLMDHIKRSEPDEFHLAGRRDGLVQVGGINVSPAAVADRLRGQPGVSAATVRLMRPEEGRRLKAFLVPDRGVDIEILRSRIVAWSAAHLSTAERPGSIVLGESLPVDVLGKATDWPA